VFYSCSNYPTCKFALWNKPIPAHCPNCGCLVAEAAKGQAGYVCTKCAYTYETLSAGGDLEGGVAPLIPPAPPAEAAAAITEPAAATDSGT
jgi:ribosomal protein S27AE